MSMAAPLAEPGHTPPHQAAADPRRTMMVARGFLCQNVAIGAAFGTFGVALLPMQEKFQAGGGLVTLAIALAVMTMGLAAPLGAALIGRIGLRALMLGGIVLSALGYVGLAFATHIGVVLVLYAIPIGLGLVAFGPFPSTILAGNWFRANPGPAIGIVNMPLFMVLVPLAAVPLIRISGLSGLYLALAGLHLALLPMAWGIVDSPDAAPGVRRPSPIPASAILKRPLFWLIALGSGVLHAAGIVASSHLVAFGIERGLTPGKAALLISVMGGASVIGAFGAGLLCARIGGGRALAVIAAGTAAGWLVLLGAQELPLMAATTLLIGAGGSAVFPAISVLAGERFGATAVTRALGLFGLATLPLNFGLPPLAGVLHDAAGGYGVVIVAIAGACGAVAVLYLLIAQVPARPVAAAA